MPDAAIPGRETATQSARIRTSRAPASRARGRVSRQKGVSAARIPPPARPALAVRATATATENSQPIPQARKNASGAGRTKPAMPAARPAHGKPHPRQTDFNLPCVPLPESSAAPSAAGNLDTTRPSTRLSGGDAHYIVAGEGAGAGASTWTFSRSVRNGFSTNICATVLNAIVSTTVQK